MMNREVEKGQIYKHFKGNLYEVMGIAKHTETEEDMVIYRPYSSDGAGEKWYARPLDMFLSEVDHDKYPDVDCEYRFTLDTSANSKMLDEKLENLLDAKSYGEKLEMLYEIKDRLTKEMIRTICITHDIELNSTDVYEQYEELKSYMLTMEKYETNRLR